MKLLFLGLMYDREKEKEYLEKSKIGMQAAANTYQWAMLDGFIENRADITLFNTLPVGTFPKYYNELAISSRKWKYRDIDCEEIGFLNLLFFKQLSRKRNYIKKIRNWIKGDDGEKTIVSYSLYLPFLKALKWLKKIHPEVKTSVVVTDLYGKNGIPTKNRIKAFLMQSYQKKIDRFTKYIDSFVILTEHMKEPLSIEERPYIIVEGINSLREENISVEKTGKKAILYTGTLNYQFGINTLLDAFSLIEDDNYELWICGDGAAKEKIISLSKEDSRIKFFGFLPKNEILKLQRQATVLINPRQNKGEYTKYSFPSKTIEYLASGTPLVAYKLDGIPDEYDEYLHYVENNSAEALKSKIVEVCEQSYEERKAFGDRAKSFVSENKNPQKQAKRILQFINE